MLNLFKLLFFFWLSLILVFLILLSVRRLVYLNLIYRLRYHNTKKLFRRSKILLDNYYFSIQAVEESLLNLFSIFLFLFFLYLYFIFIF